MLDGLNSTIFATTGSNTFIGTQTITGSILQSGSFTSTGTITAQTLVVQTVTSSTVYSSGSNIFGNSLANTQVFTGSLGITGSSHAIFGNVGIGTTSPLGQLHISSGTSGDAVLIIEADTDNNDENDTPQIWLKADGGINEGLIGLKDNTLDFINNVSTSGGFRFLTGITNTTGSTDPYTGASVKMTINSDGNVGIGTTAPTHMLDITTTRTGNGVGSTIRINRPDSGSYENAINWATGGTNKWFLGSDNDSTDNFYLYNWARSAFEIAVLSTSGNVGIGTTSPSAKLDVNGNSIITGSLTVITGSAIEFQVTNTGVRIGNIITDTHTVTGSLNISGSTTSTSFTGSLFGTSSYASNALTASYALTATSASYAATASVSSTTFGIGATIQTYGSVASSVTGSNNIFTQNTGSFTSAFFKYTAASGSNTRAGEVISVWNSTTTSYTDFSTVDIGNTNNVTASISIVTGQVQFNIQTNSSGWAIKSIATFM